MGKRQNAYPGEITFSNSCPIPDWLPAQKKEFRKNADNYFTQVFQSYALFEDKDVVVSYFQQGVGSIVAKIELSNGEMYVAKTTETPNRTIAEIKAYEAMRDNGIKVPEVYLEGAVDGHPFFVMEYFGQGTLKEQLAQNKITIEEVGEIKAEVFVALQNIPGRGYGWPTDYDGEVVVGNFADIDSFMEYWFCNPETIQVANKYEPSIPWKDELRERAEIVKRQYADSESHLGSFDFQTAHFFASNPPTFFDADPRIEPDYFALGFLLLPLFNINADDIELGKILIKKIESRSGKVPREKLRRAVWLQTFRKATNLLLRPSKERVENGTHMLKTLAEEEVLEKHLTQYF